MGYITQLFAHRFALLFIIDQFSSDGLLLKYTFIVYRNKRIKFTREFIIHRYSANNIIKYQEYYHNSKRL